MDVLFLQHYVNWAYYWIYALRIHEKVCEQDPFIGAKGIEDDENDHIIRTVNKICKLFQRTGICPLSSQKNSSIIDNLQEVIVERVDDYGVMSNIR